MGVFSSLKTACREQVEQLFRGGANTIGKQHFTLLYDRARKSALTSCNIRSGWSKTGLWPFNPDRVLGEMSKPNNVEPVSEMSVINPNVDAPFRSPDTSIRTPTDVSSLKSLIMRGEAHLKTADENFRLLCEEIANAAKMSMEVATLDTNFCSLADSGRHF